VDRQRVLRVLKRDDGPLLQDEDHAEAVAVYAMVALLVLIVSSVLAWWTW
jgi:hypothetical protein